MLYKFGWLQSRAARVTCNVYGCEWVIKFRHPSYSPSPSPTPLTPTVSPSFSLSLYLPPYLPTSLSLPLSLPPSLTLSPSFPPPYLPLSLPPSLPPSLSLSPSPPLSLSLSLSLPLSLPRSLSDGISYKDLHPNAVVFVVYHMFKKCTYFTQIHRCDASVICHQCGRPVDSWPANHLHRRHRWCQPQRSLTWCHHRAVLSGNQATTDAILSCLQQRQQTERHNIKWKRC